MIMATVPLMMELSAQWNWRLPFGLFLAKLRARRAAAKGALGAQVGAKRLANCDTRYCTLESNYCSIESNWLG